MKLYQRQLIVMALRVQPLTSLSSDRSYFWVHFIILRLMWSCRIKGHMCHQDLEQTQQKGALGRMVLWDTHASVWILFLLRYMEYRYATSGASFFFTLAR